MKKKLFLVLVATAVLILAGCQNGAQNETPDPTSEPTATNTPVPTATNTPVPTATNTPAPTATNTPVPTATNTPVPTATNTPTPEPTEIPVEEETINLTDTDIPGVYWREAYYGEEYGWYGEFVVINSDGTVYRWYQTEEELEDVTPVKVLKVTPYDASKVDYYGQGDYLIYIESDYEYNELGYDIFIYGFDYGAAFIGEESALSEGARSYRYDAIDSQYTIPSNVLFNGAPIERIYPIEFCPYGHVDPTECYFYDCGCKYCGVTFAGFNEDFGGGFLKAHNCEDYLPAEPIENPCPYKHESPDICLQVMCSCPDCGLAIFGYDYVNDEAFWRACECEN